MDVEGERSPPSSPKQAWSSDGSWVACGGSPHNTAPQDSVSEDSFVTVSESSVHPSATSTGHVPHYRPDHLDYSSNLSSKGEYSKRGAIDPYSSSSPQTYRQSFSTTSTPSSPPIAVPRAVKVKQLEEEVAKLRHQVLSLQQRNSELESQSQSASHVSGGVDSSSLQARVTQLQDQNKKLKEASELNVERLTEKISKLEFSSMSTDQEISQLRHQLREKTREADKERDEKYQLELSMTSLKKDHMRIDGERQILERERDRLKEEVKRSPITEQAPPLGRSNITRDQNVLRRLNDTIRDKKALEEVNNIYIY